MPKYFAVPEMKLYNTSALSAFVLDDNEDKRQEEVIQLAKQFDCKIFICEAFKSATRSAEVLYECL